MITISCDFNFVVKLIKCSLVKPKFTVIVTKINEFNRFGFLSNPYKNNEMNIKKIPKEISAVQLNEMIKKGNNMKIIDVREYIEWDICHIEGAENIPMNLIEQCLDKICNETPTIVLCHHGIRSRNVIHYLEVKGYQNLINLKGGIHSWAVNIDTTMTKY